MSLPHALRLFLPATAGRLAYGILPLAMFFSMADATGSLGTSGLTAAIMTGGRRPLLHFAHDPHWVFYDAAGGDRWHDFHHVRQPAGMSAEILLVPLGGHSPGQTAVAVRAGDGWLLHVGDAYYYRGEIQPDPAPVPPLLNSLQEMMETDRALRLANLERVRRLVADPSAQVQVLSAHDPWEFQRYRGGDQGTPAAARASYRL